PFVPLYDAWQADSRKLFFASDAQARAQADQIDAKVLSNRKPPYGLIGGLYDALKDTQGSVLTVSNPLLRQAAALFENIEGIDLHPAAAVAVASLIEAVNNKTVDKNHCIMLNITGGGEERFKKENVLHYLKPKLVFDIDPDFEEVKSRLQTLFAKDVASVAVAKE
ncbi:MAG: cysteate synthase, partial [Bacteroidales bacterium]|nr:cysteate synthase [Bacteroidales bacterium]